MEAQQIIGIHAPNRKLADLDGGPDTFWHQVEAGRAAWVKLLWPDHNRADAARARAMGRRVIVRAPGDSGVFASDVRDMLKEFAGLVDAFELGNEPEGADLWIHAFNIEFDSWACKTDCNRAGIRLISPGWRGNAEPPARPLDDKGKPDNRWWEDWSESDPRRLAARIIQTYGGFKGKDRKGHNRVLPGLDGIGFHAYGAHVLEGPQVDRIQRWASTFPGMLLYGTEIGIAGRDLVNVPADPARYAPSQLIKAERYAAFAGQLAVECDQVAAAVVFIADGCTPEWAEFEEAGKYAPGGTRGYTIGLAGWERLGQKIA